LEEAIRANQQKMEKFRREMEETGKQAIDRNQKKLDDIWGQLVIKVS
jgi:predicted phage tail protein